MVGKWHLGWERDDMPTHHGFDFYYGIPAGEDESDFVLGDSLTTDTVAPSELARRYTSEAIRFIGDHRQRFFMYVAHRDPHLDNYPSSEFAGRSGAGAYGDVVEQLDASVGDLMRSLREQDLDRNTLVLFMSDNGPVTPPGSAGPFSGGKFSCEEGGVRVPLIARWPARIPAGRVVQEPASSLDLFPTIVALTGATLPAKPYDGQDISRLLTGQVERIGGQGIDGGREIVFFGPTGPAGLRSGKWKYLRAGLWSGTRYTLRPGGRSGRKAGPEPCPSRPGEAARGAAPRVASLGAPAGTQKTERRNLYTSAPLPGTSIDDAEWTSESASRPWQVTTVGRPSSTTFAFDVLRHRMA